MLRTIICCLLSTFLLISLTNIAFAEDDTYVKIQEMVNDLGSPPERAKNNGKWQKCVDGGRKKITIKRTKDGTTYEGIYENCKEWGRLRNGHVIITIQ